MAPDLTLPADVFDVAEIVAREFASHEQHVLDRAAADLRARAALLRSMPSVEDELTAALMASCHTEAGRIHSAPHLVAAAACEAVAALLETPSNEEEESRG
ncbi:MAG TPA: hypothetical protein VIP77_15580 [Jiangellaceae bacterium]